MTELFRVETDRLLLSWSARGDEAQISSLAAAGPELTPRRAGLRYGAGHRCPPVPLREQTAYSVLLRSTTGEPVTLEHPDPVVLRGLQAADGGGIVFGTINFGSQVGRSCFSVRVGGEPEIDLVVEVLPTKLGYAEDLSRLTEEVQEIHHALALEYLRATHGHGSATRVPRRTGLEWLLLLEAGVDELERALLQIARHPQRALSRDPEEVRTERVGRPDAALRRALARGAGSGRQLRLAGGLPVRERLVGPRPRATLDTPEHRWLAAQLEGIRRELTRLRAREAERGAGQRAERAAAEIQRLEARVSRLCALEPLRAATAAPPPGFASLQLLSAPGYREAYRACLELALGVRLGDGAVRPATKELHLLYEYWCHLTLVRLLAEAIGSPLPARQLVAVEERGLRVLLRPGREHRVTLDGPGGMRATLTYNPRFAGDPLLVPQRPDVLLGVLAPGRPPLHAVLDAKYRVDASPEFVRRYGSPGPPEDALNSLHRYRDAIALPGAPPRRLVDQALALFPHRGDPAAFRHSRLWGALERIGVGAVPLLPGHTALLEEWLGRALRGEASTER